MSGDECVDYISANNVGTKEVKALVAYFYCQP